MTWYAVKGGPPASVQSVSGHPVESIDRMMEDLENRRAVELVKRLHCVVGVAACSTGELFLVSYPKVEPARLFEFTKEDLERAIKMKCLTEADTIKINGQKCQVYMKTVKAANEG